MRFIRLALLAAASFQDAAFLLVSVKETIQARERSVSVRFRFPESRGRGGNPRKLYKRDGVIVVPFKVKIRALILKELLPLRGKVM